mmetsp:Transcript_37001/g.42206  ORF Transcript_37001/g.42206 Transcript_37001/m.42206 type:complete len:156 (-) Transcript_37001:177-644(-)
MVHRSSFNLLLKKFLSLSMFSMISILVLVLLLFPTTTNTFSPSSLKSNIQHQQRLVLSSPSSVLVVVSSSISTTKLYQKKINKERRQQLGIADDEDEYDLEMALDNGTDPFITKVIAGSFIIVMIALLVVGVVIPSITDYSSDGLCSPIQNGGKC